MCTVSDQQELANSKQPAGGTCDNYDIQFNSILNSQKTVKLCG